jgi:IclR family transcriptional regulator, KDG regulon repressor
VSRQLHAQRRVKGIGSLELLARSERTLGVTESAAHPGIGENSVHRLLQALIELGYVLRDPAGSCAASIRLWDLGSAMVANLDLRQASQAWMDWLLARSRESVHLSVLDGDEVVYVHTLDGTERVRACSRIGGQAPAHCVASGKATLAWQGEVALESIAQRLQAWPLRTVTDPGERMDTAIGLSGPIDRLRPAGLRLLSADVIRAAEGMSASRPRPEGSRGTRPGARPGA